MSPHVKWYYIYTSGYLDQYEMSVCGSHVQASESCRRHRRHVRVHADQVLAKVENTAGSERAFGS